METEYLSRHSEELIKHRGKCVSIVKGKLVAIGRDRLEAYEKARREYPKEKIAIFYIPTEDEMVPLLWNFPILSIMIGIYQ